MKKCLDCKSTMVDDLESDMEETIPMWYKQEGNYSRYHKALTCDEKFNPNKVDLKEETPDITDKEVKVKTKVPKNTWTFYWAADSQTNPTMIKKAQNAYGLNYGLVKSDKKGDVTFTLNCPQPYEVDKVVYPRHVHYVSLTKKNVWDDKVKTLVVTCHITKDDLQEILKSKTHIVLNALPEDYYEKDHIPDSYNLPCDSLTVTNRKKKVKIFLRNVLSDFPKLQKLIKDKKLTMETVPIVTYCANSKCSASDQLIKHLMNAGFVNVTEYPEGMDGWNNDKKVDDKKKIDEKKSDKKVVDDKTLTFFDDEISDDKYDLNITKETLVLDTIPYIHNLENQELYDTDDNLVGLWDGEKVIWEDGEEKKHKQRIQLKVEVNDEEETEQEQEEDEKDEPVEDEPEEPEPGEEDEPEEEDEPFEDEPEEDEKVDVKVDVKKEIKKDKTDDKLNKLKQLLSNIDRSEKSLETSGGGVNKQNDYKKDHIQLVSNDSIANHEFTKKFRGWGLTFF